VRTNRKNSVSRLIRPWKICDSCLLTIPRLPSKKRDWSTSQRPSAIYHDYAKGTYVISHGHLVGGKEWKHLDKELTNYAHIKDDFRVESPESRKNGLMLVILGNEAYHRPPFELKTYEGLPNLFAVKEFHRGDLQSEH